MNIAVMGAGAIGCYFGGLLFRAGHRVSLIGRQPHVEAIARHGLRWQRAEQDLQLNMSASTEATACHDADWVLVCVKSTDTQAVARQLLGRLRPDALLLSLQNGISNAEQLRAVLPQQVLPVASYVAVAMVGPGHVRHLGGGELAMGPSAHSDTLAGCLRAAGIPTRIEASVETLLWSKLAVNCAWNALSAIAQQPYAALIEQADVLQLMQDAVAECLAVAAASGIQLPADSWTQIRSLAERMPTQYSSTAQDLRRGKPSEISALNGEVVRLGQALGVPTPVNRALSVCVQLLEARGPA